MIEALWSRIELFAGEGKSQDDDLVKMKEQACAAQANMELPRDIFHWSLMEFFKAEADLLKAENMYKNGDHEAKKATKGERMPLHEQAMRSYRAALRGLTGTDPIKARECKEGLAGALSGLAECEGRTSVSDAHIREARALFQEVVDSAKINTPEGEYAGALENLATALHTMANHFAEERELALQEERKLLLLALDVYRDIEDEGGVARVRRRLD